MMPERSPDAAPTVSVAEAEDIRDIRGPVPFPSSALLLWVVVAVLLLVSIGAWLLRRARRPAATPAPPGASAVALDALDRARQWMSPDQAERFGIAVSSAVRQYIEARFDVSAPRRTTEEFLRDLLEDPSPALSPHAGRLGDLLQRMDLVKFAREPLNETEMEGLLTTARSFVQSTAPPPTEGTPT